MNNTVHINSILRKLPFSWILTPTFIDRIAAKYDKLQSQISLKHNRNDIIVQYSSLNSDNLSN